MTKGRFLEGEINMNRVLDLLRLDRQVPATPPAPSPVPPVLADPDGAGLSPREIFATRTGRLPSAASLPPDNMVPAGLTGADMPLM